MYLQKSISRIGVVFVLGLMLVVPTEAWAMKYMSMKDAIKHFIPPGSKPFKVQKTIPAAKLEEIKARFNLRATADFKEKISKGPYTFFIARDPAGNPTAYIVILEQYWRTCHHKYAIGITPDGKIKEVVVTDLNCPYAYPINRKSFLKQFKGKHVPPGKKPGAEVGKDVDAVSGATASSDATAIVARRALALYGLFFSQQR